MTKKVDFGYWFEHEFLFSRDPLSPVLSSGNREARAKFMRLGKVAEMVLKNTNDEEVREQVVVQFMLTPRIALDYIHQAKLIIKEYNKRQALNS
jgi:hypothetical protein